jgi:ubiquitin-like 1-activating enzyme E1 B
MEDMWKEKSPPEALDFDKLTAEAAEIDPSVSQDDQNTWTTAQSFVVFRDSLSRLAKRLAEEQATALQNNSPPPIVAFDKDDDDTLDFVTATANLRAHIFGIGLKSKFDTKQMAGNIIPAIATTNAMIAGLCVLQAFKVLRGDYNKTKMMFLDRGNMSAGPFDPPNPDCVVCNASMARLQIDPARATLKDVVNEVLKTKLNYNDEISILSEEGLVYDPDLEDNLEKKVKELGIDDGSVVTVQDENEDGEEQPRVDLRFFVETMNIPRRTKKQPALSLTNDNGVEVLTNGTAPAPSGKRKRDADEAGLDAKDTPVKKVQITKPADEKEVMVIEDDDGAIVFDD